MGAEVKADREPVTINPQTGQSSDFKGRMMFYEERFNPKPKKEKIDKPGTVLSRAFDKLVSKFKKNEAKKEVAVETKKAIAKEKVADLPKKPYDLQKAMDHFKALDPGVQAELLTFFNAGDPSTGKAPYEFFDNVYDFQDKKGIKKDGIAGPEVRKLTIEAASSIR